MKLKSYQQVALNTLQQFLDALNETRAKQPELAALGVGDEWVRLAWKQVRGERLYSPSRNGLGEQVPTVCLKVPTGGGKTLLAVKAIDLIHHHYQRNSHGLVLWIVPTNQIYRQTLEALRDRAHPYRQSLDLASGGKTLILEKDQVFTPDDVAQQLVILMLMLPSANRQKKISCGYSKIKVASPSSFPPRMICRRMLSCSFAAQT